MTGTTTGQTSLATATDSDDTESYLTTSLVSVLQAVANLFESATGHDHTGAGKGKPIGSAGIATGIALTNPVVGGAGGTPAGTLGFSGTKLLVGDGTVNESVNVGPWTTWAPTLNQGGVVTFTTNLARYCQIGKTILVQLQLTMTGAGVGANNIAVGNFPVTPLTANADFAVGTFRYDGVAIRIGAVCMVTTSTFQFQVDNSAGFLGVAPNVALAAGQVLTFQAAFEAA